MFIYNTTIKLYDTDAAGLLFFGNQFKIAHAAYESFMESINLGLNVILREANFLLPIIHAEADYLRPLFVGDKIIVKIQLERIGKSSFTLSYNFLNQEEESFGTAKTVHVAISKKDGTKIPLPEKLKISLDNIK